MSNPSVQRMENYKEGESMNFHKFIKECFHGWSIASITTCGTDCGNIKLRSGETFVRVFFQLHGDTHWTGPNVTIDHIEAVEGLI